MLLYITIILYESTQSCVKFKTHLRAHQSSCFRGGRIKEKIFTRKVWWLSTPWSSILRQPKHWFVFFFQVPIKEVVYLARDAPWLWNPKLAIRHFDVIDNEMKKNKELSLVKLQRTLLVCCYITVSARTISSQWNLFSPSCSECAPAPQKFWHSFGLPAAFHFTFHLSSSNANSLLGYFYPDLYHSLWSCACTFKDKLSQVNLVMR